MEINIIERLPELCERLNLISDYDLRCTTDTEMLYILAEKINSLMVKHNYDMVKVNDKFIQYSDKLEYLLSQGLTEEIKKIINKMYAEGKLQELLGEALIDVNRKLRNTNTKIDEETQNREQAIMTETQNRERAIQEERTLRERAINKINEGFAYNEEDLKKFVREKRNSIMLKNNIEINEPLNLDRFNIEIDLNGYELKLSDNYNSDYIFRIGETEYNDFYTKYKKWIKNGVINMNDKSAYVLNHTFSWSLHCIDLRVVKAKEGFIKYTVTEEQTTRGAEALFSNISIVGSDTIQAGKLAFDLYIGDSIYEKLYSQYFGYGIRTRAGGCIIRDFHVWGVHNKAGRPNHVMWIGVINEAYYNIYENGIADTPELKNDTLTPGRINGGIGYYDHLSAETRYINCQVFGNSNQKDKAIVCHWLNKPDTVSDEYYGQSMIFDNCFTRETKKIHSGIYFTGKSRTLQMINCNFGINIGGKVRGYNQLCSNATVFKKDLSQKIGEGLDPWATCPQENSFQMVNDDYGISILVRDNEKQAKWIRLMAGVDAVVNKADVGKTLTYLNEAKKSGIAGGVIRNIGFVVFDSSISSGTVGRYEYYMYIPSAEQFLKVRTGEIVTT